MSDFLTQYYQQRANKLHADDPLDPLGPRLPPDWRPNDTIMTVSLRRIYQPIKKLLDPRNYSKQKYEQLKKKSKLYRDHIRSLMIISLMPLAYLIPYVIPRVQMARREFQFHRLMKSSFLRKQLGGKRPSLEELRKTLKQEQTRINL